VSLDHARAVADAVLYEGYLLYPYRASSSKNQSRWQFGVLGPPGALEAGVGEDPALASQFLVRPARPGAVPTISVQLRFLQLQRRAAQRADASGDFVDVPELVVGARRWLSWEEAVEGEFTFGPWDIGELLAPKVEPIAIPAGTDLEPIRDDTRVEAGRIVRSHRSLAGEMRIGTDEPPGSTTGLVRVSVRVDNTTAGAGTDKESAIAASFIGAHLLLEVRDGEFVSMTDPPADAAEAVAACRQHRCWPVLAGPDGDPSVLLVSPIILYDHPELAPQSAGALFDSTEIDEILTLRVMTLTAEEKAAARATDSRAAEIIDRCDAMSPEAMQQLHGILRDPHALDAASSGSLTSTCRVPSASTARCRGGIRPSTAACRPTAMRSLSTAWQCPTEPWCGYIRHGARTLRTCSSRGSSPGSLRCTPTSTETRTSPSSWSTTRHPTCTIGTAATCTSLPTSSNQSRNVRRRRRIRTTERRVDREDDRNYRHGRHDRARRVGSGGRSALDPRHQTLYEDSQHVTAADRQEEL
jgi:hypothetical protein